MKKWLAAFSVLTVFSASAVAADLPMKAAPVALFNWTGWYGGINGGYSWGKSRVVVGTTPTPTVTKSDHDGGLASGEGGYCWQSPGSTSVTCLELRYDFPKEKGSVTVPGVPVIANTQIDPFLFGPHFGVTTDQNRQLWYVAGGLAVGQVGGSASAGGVDNVDVGSKWKAGWFLGLGTERMIDQHWSWKFEYDYVRISDGGGATGAFAGRGGVPAGTTVDIGGKAYDNIVTVGINYHFGSR